MPLVRIKQSPNDGEIILQRSNFKNSAYAPMFFGLRQVIVKPIDNKLSFNLSLQACEFKF